MGDPAAGADDHTFACVAALNGGSCGYCKNEKKDSAKRQGQKAGINFIGRAQHWDLSIIFPPENRWQCAHIRAKTFEKQLGRVPQDLDEIWYAYIKLPIRFFCQSLHFVG